MLASWRGWIRGPPEYQPAEPYQPSSRHNGDDPDGSQTDAQVDAEQFGYVYDPIGNRVTYDEDTPPVPTTYEANQLNQYFRADTDRPSPDNDFGQGYRFDEDGNLIEAFVAADMDCDGQVTGFDIDAFVLALTDPEGYAQQYPDCDPLNGDMDGDGQLTGFDTDLFTQHLAGCTDGYRIEGVLVGVKRPAETVADCLKYRHKIGTDVAIEALRFCWRQRRPTLLGANRSARVAARVAFGELNISPAECVVYGYLPASGSAAWKSR